LPSAAASLRHQADRRRSESFAERAAEIVERLILFGRRLAEYRRRCSIVQQRTASSSAAAATSTGRDRPKRPRGEVESGHGMPPTPRPRQRAGEQKPDARLAMDLVAVMMSKASVSTRRRHGSRWII